MQTLSSNLRAERARRCWTAQDLADRAGLSAFTVYEIEQQKGNPSLLTLTKIAGAFGLSVLELLAPSPTSDSAQNNGRAAVDPGNSPTPAQPCASEPSLDGDTSAHPDGNPGALKASDHAKA